jgi:RimJ/RimL family protein N-acetyltransferase
MKLESSKKHWPWQRTRAPDGLPAPIEGRLVALRPKRLEDAEADYAWRTDSELARLDATAPLMISFPEYLRYHRDDLEFPSPWSVRLAIDTLDGRHIGNCMYYDIDAERKQAEMGIMIGDRAFWGRGYGTDAVKALLRHIFTATPIERVYLHTLAGNSRAQRAFARAGLKPAGDVHRDGYEFLKMEARKDGWLAAHPVEGSAAFRGDSDEGAASSDNGAAPS